MLFQCFVFTWTTSCCIFSVFNKKLTRVNFLLFSIETLLLLLLLFFFLCRGRDVISVFV
jgi:hypothetical protein